MTQRLNDWRRRYGRMAAEGLGSFLVTSGVLMIVAASLMHTPILGANSPQPSDCTTSTVPPGGSKPFPHCVAVGGSGGWTVYKCCSPQAPSGGGCGTGQVFVPDNQHSSYQYGCTFAGYDGITPMWCCNTSPPPPVIIVTGDPIGTKATGTVQQVKVTCKVPDGATYKIKSGVGTITGTPWPPSAVDPLTMSLNVAADGKTAETYSAGYPSTSLPANWPDGTYTLKANVKIELADGTEVNDVNDSKTLTIGGAP